MWIKAVDSLGNTTIVKSNPFRISNTAPTVQISAYKADSSGKSVGNALKTVTNNNLTFSGWKNYGLNFHIKSSSVVGNIKSKKTYDLANSQASWNAGGKGVFNQSSKVVGLTGDGVRLGKITVTDEAGNTRTVTVRTDVDKTPPSVSFKMIGTKYSNGYYSGAVVHAVCSDALSGIIYMYTYDTQDTSDVIEDKNLNKLSTRTHGIRLVTRGQTRNITTICKDAVGNSTGSKKSPTYKIY